ncbi:hypothetical protein DFH94DRAFT_683160 [Russula ochroleuca]|uniref:Uncharacterized protein n=1 Tax=Russula ochroleuca TaxID=152965 RepID=A0A9P5T684_9AGAM|nr:hypothetical protein DFH94DRAFT_683160 [Russula ochroleuca]
MSLDIGPPLPLPSPAPEAFGMVQSIAGARAEGHPVHVMSGSHCLSPAPWYMTMGMQEKVSGQEDGWTPCKYCAIALAKRPSGPLTKWSPSSFAINVHLIYVHPQAILSKVDHLE